MSVFNKWVILKVASHVGRDGDRSKAWSHYEILDQVYGSEEETLAVANSLPRSKGEWSNFGKSWEGFQAVPEELALEMKEVGQDGLAELYVHARGMRDWEYGREPILYPPRDGVG